MANTKNSYDRYIAGFGLSFAITSIVTSLLVVIKESYEPLLNFMKSLGHHWVTHGIFTILLFVILGFVLSKDSFAEKMGILKLNKLIAITALGGPLIIMVFFLVHQ